MGIASSVERWVHVFLNGQCLKRVVAMEYFWATNFDNLGWD